MTVPIYPTDFPYQVNREYMVPDVFGGNVISAEMEDGYRQRRRRSVGITEVPWSVTMRKEDWEDVRDWHLANTGGAIARFSMRVWNGTEYVQRDCMFKDGKVSVKTLGATHVTIEGSLMVFGL